jgi:hypothetical protein
MSEIWNHFKVEKSLIYCNHCDDSFNPNKDSSTSKFWKHLEGQHLNEYKSTKRGQQRKIHNENSTESYKQVI